MYSRIFVLILAISVGVGIGFGASTVAGLVSDGPSIGGLSRRSAESLVEQLTPGESSALDPQQVALVVESLVQILDEEINERRILAEQLEEVRSEMSKLQRNLSIRPEATSSANAANTASQQPGAQAGQSLEGRLAASGFTPQQIENVRRRESEASMQQVELDDRARREGWANTYRYFEEFNSLTSALDNVRHDLGDDDTYDRYLFASGQPNRVSVGMVIETSPAEQAGLQQGDVIRSYAGERVFSTAQLTALRSGGVKGMPVIVEIIRGGELIQIWMPRGPMGIRTQLELADPSAPGSG